MGRCQFSVFEDNLVTQIVEKKNAQNENESLKATEKSLKPEIEDLKRQREELSQDQAYFSQELEMAKTENQGLVDRCTDLVLRLESVQESKETQTEEDFQGQIKGLVKQKEPSEEDLENVKIQNFTVIRDLSEQLSGLEDQVQVQKVEKAGLSEELAQKITAIESFQAQISHQESLIAQSKAREAEVLQQTALKEGLLEQTERDLVSKICALTSTSVCLAEAQEEIQVWREKVQENEAKLEGWQNQNGKLQEEITNVSYSPFYRFSKN